MSIKRAEERHQRKLEDARAFYDDRTHSGYHTQFTKFTFDQLIVYLVPYRMDLCCYILEDDESGRCVIIDPGDFFGIEDLFTELEVKSRRKMQPLAVLLTQDHPRRMGGLRNLDKKYRDIQLFTLKDRAEPITAGGYLQRVTPLQIPNFNRINISAYRAPSSKQGTGAIFQVKVANMTELLFTGDTFCTGSLWPVELPLLNAKRGPHETAVKICKYFCKDSILFPGRELGDYFLCENHNHRCPYIERKKRFKEYQQFVKFCRERVDDFGNRNNTLRPTVGGTTLRIEKKINKKLYENLQLYRKEMDKKCLPPLEEVNETEGAYGGTESDMDGPESAEDDTKFFMKRSDRKFYGLIQTKQSPRAASTTIRNKRRQSRQQSAAKSVERSIIDADTFWKWQIKDESDTSEDSG